MSCHIEIDFNDDGTIVMTGRPSKGAAVRKTELGHLDRGIHTITIAAGDNGAVTHRLMLMRAGTLVVNASEWAA